MSDEKSITIKPKLLNHKHDTVELQLRRQALEVLAKSLKVLLENIKTGILDLDNAYVQGQIDMNKKQILKKHKEVFNCWKSEANGLWFTYLPKKDVQPPKGKLVKKTTEEKLNNAIINFYIGIEKAKAVPSFNDVSEDMRTVKDLKLASVNSIDRYDSDFKRFFEHTAFGETPIDQITENTITVFVLESIRDKKLCKEAVKKMFAYIRLTIKHARIEKIIDTNPVEFLELKDFTGTGLCVNIEKTVEEKQYSDDDVKQMLALLEVEYSKRPNYIPNYAIEMAIYTGMRVGELAGLKWEDIGEDSIYICRSEKYNSKTREYYIGDVKNKKPRHFPLDDTIRNLLLRIRKVYMNHGGMCEWVFSSDEKRINLGTLSSCNKNRWKQLGRKAKSGIHGYRHRLSSNLRTKGISATIVASIMGHSVQTNNIHYNRNTASLKEMVDIITDENIKLSA